MGQTSIFFTTVRSGSCIPCSNACLILPAGACWFLVQPLCKPSLEGSGDKGMTSLSDLYVFYCRRSSCQPNSKFLEQLMVDEKETRVFDFSKNFLGSKGFDPALETARNNMKLERLDFSDNWLTKDSVLKIVKVAIRHPTLTSINLSNNPLHLSCCKALLHLLQRNANITELQLEGTEIVPAMKERIAREVEANRTRTADEKAKLLQFEAEHRMRKALAPELLPGNVAVGEWKGETAGGCLTYTTWRENPQFLLYPAEDGLCTLELRQRDRLVDCDGESKNLQKVVMGLLVVQGTGVQRILSIKKGSIVGESEYSDDEKVRLQVRLESRQKGRDLPYIVIATTVHPGREARFTLSCHSQVDDIHDETRFLLDAVDDAYDWFRTPRIQSSWTESTSGGDRKNTSWRANPQFCITFNERTRRAVRMVILLAKSLDEESNDERTIGFYVVRGMLNRQRRIVLKPFHLIGESQFVRKASVSLELEVDPCVEGYYIIPATKDRGHIGPFTLTVYATSEVNVKPIDSSRDWPEYVIHNAWTETTNGGYRSRNQGSWLHNPSFPLHVASPTDVLICLERAGRATSVRIATSAFKSAADKGQIGVGLLLTSNDDEFKTLRESEFVYEGEATIFLENLPPKKDGYLIVPCTFDAGDHSNYILRLYSSKPLGEGSLEPMRRMEERAREKEAEQHARVNVKKRKEPSSPKSLKGARPTSESQDSLQQQEETAAAQQREAIIEACLRSGQKYVDREFPPGPSSLYFEADCPPEPAPPVRTWKRASEVRDNPQLFLHRHTIVRTGHWNDASLLGAFGLLGVRPEQLQNLFVAAYPEHGFYQVRYFQFGVWKTLTIDDYLPVDSNDGLVFAQSEDPNEIWVSLLEKAYAKLHGSYQSLQHGSEQEALMDITGGLVDPLRMSEPGDPPVPLNKRESTYAHVWDTLVQYDANQWFVGCGAFDKGQVTEGNYGVGILYNKLYAVVDCRAVQGHKLVRLRNPWGLLEWAGRWSDTSEHWTDELQRVLDYRREPDGTFWMSFADFCYFFNRLYLCRLPSDRDSYLFRWYGAWDGTGGGTENHKTFIANQQFALNLAQPSAEPVNLYIVLSQPDAPDGVYTGIGFYIIETDDNTQRLLRLTDREVIHGSGFERTRQIAMVVSLSSARKYVFVPTTQDLRKRGDYMVTMSADKKVACDLITRDADVVVEGKWKGLTAGGGPGVFGTWRRNTQWLLYPSVDATVTLTLRQHALPHGPSAPLPMGLLVLDGKQIKRTLEYAPADVMATTGHDASAEVVLQVALNSVQTRAGRPYVLIPSLYSPTQEAGYTLTARCNKRLQLQQVDPDFDWVHTQVNTSSWMPLRGDARSARCNTQFAPLFLLRILRLVVRLGVPNPALCRGLLPSPALLLPLPSASALPLPCPCFGLNMIWGSVRCTLRTKIQIGINKNKSNSEGGGSKNDNLPFEYLLAIIGDAIVGLDMILGLLLF